MFTLSCKKAGAGLISPVFQATPYCRYVSWPYGRLEDMW